MIRAYRMMLDFFGIELQNEASGKLRRANNCRVRMAHLNRFVSIVTYYLLLLYIVIGLMEQTMEPQ